MAQVGGLSNMAEAACGAALVNEGQLQVARGGEDFIAKHRRGVSKRARDVTARGDARWRFEYVSAKPNLAYIPSRQFEVTLMPRCDTTHGRIQEGFESSFATRWPILHVATVSKFKTAS